MEVLFFQPRKLPGDPKLLEFGNNIVIASGVTFINHDVMHHVFNNMEEDSAEYYMGCIEICDNVFIGSNSLIVQKNGSSCIIAADSVITKDVPTGSIVADTPAKVIGNFNDVYNQRKQEFQMNKQKK